MLFLIANNQICGTTDTADPDLIQLPDGWEIHEGPDLDPSLVFWDGQQVQAKPTQPTEGHRWDGDTNTWLLPAMPLKDNDWERLQASFRGTALMGKCFTAAGQDLTCNAAFTMLYGAITQTRNLDDFAWSLGQMRAAMTANPEIGDFTPEEINSINAALTDAGFESIS